MLGRNGAGKTTLLRSITGVNPPRNGTIELNGADITRLKSHERAQLGISYVPQGRQIIPDITVQENLELALLGKGRRRDQMPAYVLDYFPALKALPGARAACFAAASSSSSRSPARWCRSRSCCCSTSRPKDCSPRWSRRSRTSSSGSTERKCSVLLVEQRLDFVRDITRRFAILDTGRIVARGDIHELTDEVVRKHVQV